MLRLSHQDYSIFKRYFLYRSPFTTLLCPSLHKKCYFLSSSTKPNGRVQEDPFAKVDSSISEFDIPQPSQDGKDYFVTIAKSFGVEYLGNVSEATMRKFSNQQAQGAIRDWMQQFVIPLPVTITDSQKSVMMIFIVDLGSPSTILSEEAAFVCEATEKSMAELIIMGEKTFVRHSVEDEKFKNINILGTDFLEQIKAEMLISFPDKKFTLTKKIDMENKD